MNVLRKYICCSLEVLRLDPPRSGLALLLHLPGNLTLDTAGAEPGGTAVATTVALKDHVKMTAHSVHLTSMLYLSLADLLKQKAGKQGRRQDRRQEQGQEIDKE